MRDGKEIFLLEGEYGDSGVVDWRGRVVVAVAAAVAIVSVSAIIMSSALVVVC